MSFAVCLCLSMIHPGIDAQKVIFLHHTTGGNVYNQGNVPGWISNYNNENDASIEISERMYPDTPYPWQIDPYDYWKLWVEGDCDGEQPGTACIDDLVEQYQVIIFKHGSPGAAIEAGSGSPDVTSEQKTLGNYMLQYRALREMMDHYPGTLFIVWTLAPLHRLSTNPEEATRAREFVDWVKNDWLDEDGIDHQNIRIFDFWGYAAETSENPDSGAMNCLKYEYELSHSDGDSHPNLAANEWIGPLFAEFIASEISDFKFAMPWDPVNPNASDDVKKVLRFLYDIRGKGILTGQENLATDVMNWTDEVVDITGLYPGLLGEDFSYGDSAFVKRQRIVNAAREYWDSGGLVTISWHQVNPQTWDGSIHEGPFEYTQYSMTQETFNQLFVPESDLQVKYQRHIDTIAGYLKKLQEAGVVVLWRPYHEMNGGWFWWGAKNNFGDLWRGMYARYTYYHKLNNLIWVWGPNISQGALESYYPGDDYVDVVGLDGYTGINNWDIRTSLKEEINSLISLSKGNMVSFTELGVLPDPDWLQADRPEFTWFLCWWTHITDANSNRWINDVYHHDFAINRGDYLWDDFPVVLVREFEDLDVINTGESVTVSSAVSSHFYVPSGHEIQLDVSTDRSDIAMMISDSIILYPSPADTGTITFQVVAGNAADSLVRRFSVNLQSPVSVRAQSKPEERITLYPNPAGDRLQISGMNGIESILIYDLSGRLLRYISNHRLPERLVDITEFDEGYYTICFLRADGMAASHFMKQ
jgi:mannan endo-1,4-beta-mannosidase